MARWEFKLPDLGEGVTEGEIVAWLVRPGDLVKEDQPMVEVMTDKATVTITAPRAGTVAETHGNVGEIVQVHAVLIVFDLDGSMATSNGTPRERGGNGHANGDVPGGRSPAGHRPPDVGPAATAVGDIRESLPGMGRPRVDAPGPQAQRYFNAKPLATPATRKLARDMNVDLRLVRPSGPQGRVTAKDVAAFRSGEPASPPSSARGHEHVSSGPSAAPGANDSSSGASLRRQDQEERVPFTGLRRRIAQKMQQSTQTAAHFTFVEECDVTELKSLRARLKPAAETEGVRLSFLPFIVKATVAALKKHPMLNTSLDEASGELVFRKYFNIGVATATDAGLVVPVVKDADRKSILEIAREIERLAAETRAGKAKLEDLQGSTFTITSLGAQGGLLATPIINFPEVGILGVHRIKERPVVREGQIVIGDVMLLSLSFDHRVVDGHVGAAFAYEIIGYLEKPDRLFLEMV
jgi:pyruvate dehydrogenase E2 component (dihydrolipoamide acetyltransferase)